MFKLSYKDKKLKYKHVRVRWRCEGCGKRLYDDYKISPGNTSARSDPAPAPRSILTRPVTIDAVTTDADTNDAVTSTYRQLKRPAQETTLSVADEPPETPIDPTHKVYLPIGCKIPHKLTVQQVELPVLRSDQDLFYFLRQYIRQHPLSKWWYFGLKSMYFSGVWHDSLSLIFGFLYITAPLTLTVLLRCPISHRLASKSPKQTVWCI